MRTARSSRSTTTARRAPSACSRAGSDRCSTSTRARARSANVETAELLARFVRAGHQTLAFTRSRRGAELVAAARAAAALDARATSAATARRVAAYRAGYLPEERRELERELSSGRLLGIAATNALELGIDVGGLDAVVLNGFPGTLASMWQQAGPRRAHRPPVGGGARRRRRPARPVVRRASARADRAALPERAVVNPQNPFVLRAQVACAAHELPLAPDDERWFGDGLDDAVRDLVHADLLKPRGGQMYWCGRATAGAATSGCAADRRSSTASIDRDEERTIGTVDDARVFAVAHPGAVYLHQGRQYRVDELDTARSRRVARASTTTPTSTPNPAPRPTSRSSPRTQFATLGAAIGAPRRGRGPQPGRRVPAQADLDERA